jgi:hypothetical protein
MYIGHLSRSCDSPSTLPENTTLAAPLRPRHSRGLLPSVRGSFTKRFRSSGIQNAQSRSHNSHVPASPASSAELSSRSDRTLRTRRPPRLPRFTPCAAHSSDGISTALGNSDGRPLQGVGRALAGGTVVLRLRRVEAWLRVAYSFWVTALPHTRPENTHGLRTDEP